MSTPRKKLADEFASSLPAKSRHRQVLVAAAAEWASRRGDGPITASMRLEPELVRDVAVALAGCVDGDRRGGMRYIAGLRAFMPTPDVVDDLEQLGLVERSPAGVEVGMPDRYRPTSFAADAVLPLVCARRAG